MLFINQLGRKWLVVVVLLITTSSLFAQRYTIVPNDSIIANAPFNDLTHFNITQTNLSGTHLVFNWQQIELSIPLGWTANLCDNGYCYTNFPVSGIMDTVYNGDVGLMSVGIDPGEVSGVAVIRYALWEQESPDNIDTLTWIISAGLTGINDPQNDLCISMNPNPASDFIQVSVQTPLLLTITNMAGKHVFSQKLAKGFHTLPVNTLPDGHYFITAKNTLKVTTRHFTIQH